jgi:hypothetical protein
MACAAVARAKAKTTASVEVVNKRIGVSMVFKERFANK